ncbi:brevican core protein-like isoform X2 [Ptychodera flava]|uniref:brevican core protein-like isoform X2 n=1 Tax=Ptychodera flava TaxID=63121 RepID=UPI00396A6007
MASRIGCTLFVLVLIHCVQVFVEGYPFWERSVGRRPNNISQKKDVKLFSVQGCDGPRSLDYAEAMAECKLRYGATIASYMHLYQAWRKGYQKCAPSWLNMGTVGYPMQRRSRRCGNRYGIVSLGFRDVREKYDVFCYPDDESVYFVEACNGAMTFDEAEAECQRQGNSIATYDQLEEEWEDGYQYCKPGWLADERVGYPAHDQSDECGDEPGVVDLGVHDRSERYGVFCYRSDDD